jgi:DNA-binding NarL/FixJ family response regulator
MDENHGINGGRIRMDSRTARLASSGTLPDIDHMGDANIGALLYEQCEVYRIGMRTVLESTADMVVVGEAATLDAAVSCIRATTPSVALVGLTGPEEAATVVRSVRAQVSTPIPVLVLGTAFDHDAMLEVLTAGARGFLDRDTPAARLVAAVRSVAEGGMVLAASEADSLVQRITAPHGGHHVPGMTMKEHSSLEALTPRQQEVFRLVAEGLSNVDIARRMHLSVATVKSHLSGTLQKLDVRDRTQLAVLAHQYGLAPPPLDGE